MAAPRRVQESEVREDKLSRGPGSKSGQQQAQGEEEEGAEP